MDITLPTPAVPGTLVSMQDLIVLCLDFVGPRGFIGSQARKEPY